jgi:uncharacterized protein YeaO (DUF488 family)
MAVRTRRLQEKRAVNDGYRIFVSRVWPKELTKSLADVDLWLKDIAPSKELREWFSHDPQKWNMFLERYKAEINTKEKSVRILKEKIKKFNNVTLVYSASDRKYNSAIALKQILDI